MVVDSKRSSEIGLLAQIEKLIGWLAATETAGQHLGQAAAVLRSCFVEEAKLEQRIHDALTQDPSNDCLLPWTRSDELE